jgi:flagellar motor switch protein FliM
MSDKDLLSQDEIDALLHGVDSGDVPTEDQLSAHDGVARPIDLASQERILRGRMPALETINERLARHLRNSMAELLHRPVEITVAEVRMEKFSEYLHALPVPTSLNMIRAKPLRGTALLVLEARLVFMLVDHFFGGGGRFNARAASREFTVTETRVMRMVLERVFAGMSEAWEPVLPLEFEYLKTEANPQFAEIMRAGELMVVCGFKMELEGGGGELQVALPYSMIEPIRELLEARVQGERSEGDARWLKALRDEIRLAPVEVSSKLVELELSVKELLRLKPGDVLPMDMPERVTLYAEGIPAFHGRFGASQGRHAIQVIEPVRRESDGTNTQQQLSQERGI